jgi:hypothetical protein
MPTLADIYSAIDSAKRRGSDFVRNPGASLQQMLGYANDRARALDEQTGQAAQATLQSGSLRNPQGMRLAETIAEGFNPSGIFIGPNAAIFNKGMAAKALQMEKAGASPEEIWTSTGTFRGPDKQWRQEISDKAADITDDVYHGIKAEQQFIGPVSKALEHEELYKAYPEIGNVKSYLYAAKEPRASFDTGSNTLMAQGPSTQSQKSGVLHELQHAIQNKEGFARGGSPENVGGITNQYQVAKSQFDEAYKTRMDKNADPIAKENAIQIMNFYGPKLRQLKKLSDPYEAYKHLAGEAEARAVQARMSMTDAERKAAFPYQSYDVPIQDLIFNYR